MQILILVYLSSCKRATIWFICTYYFVLPSLNKDFLYLLPCSAHQHGVKGGSTSCRSPLQGASNSYTNLAGQPSISISIFRNRYCGSSHTTPFQNPMIPELRAFFAITKTEILLLFFSPLWETKKALSLIIITVLKIGFIRQGVGYVIVMGSCVQPNPYNGLLRNYDTLGFHLDSIRLNSSTPWNSHI